MIQVNDVVYDVPVFENEILDQAQKQVEKTVKIKRIKFALNCNQRKELLEIAEQINFKHYLMIRTMLESGLRVNELANLIKSDLNLTENYIEVQSRIAGRGYGSFQPKTKSSNRQIPITRSLSKELRGFISGNRFSMYVFPSRKNPHVFQKWNIIHFIDEYALKCKSIKKQIGSHALRRTYASYLLANKVPIERISKVLGHSSLRTTMIYLFEISDLEFDAIRDVVNKMNKRVLL